MATAPKHSNWERAFLDPIVVTALFDRDFVISMLPDDNAVRDVVLRKAIGLTQTAYHRDLTLKIL